MCILKNGHRADPVDCWLLDFIDAVGGLLFTTRRRGDVGEMAIFTPTTIAAIDATLTRPLSLSRPLRICFFVGMVHAGCDLN